MIEVDRDESPVTRFTHGAGGMPPGCRAGAGPPGRRSAGWWWSGRAGATGPGRGRARERSSWLSGSGRNAIPAQVCFDANGDGTTHGAGGMITLVPTLIGSVWLAV